ncbi:hypothetical protein I35_6097 [Burkholderia cenocepacia H111]|nr:hypothetical protein I35_6097 [Burkholderia cenocepacia H111]
MVDHPARRAYENAARPHRTALRERERLRAPRSIARAAGRASCRQRQLAS